MVHVPLIHVCVLAVTKKRKKVYLPFAEQLGSQKILDYLLRFNKFDIELYEYAQRLNIQQMIGAHMRLPPKAAEAAAALGIPVPEGLAPSGG